MQQGPVPLLPPCSWSLDELTAAEKAAIAAMRSQDPVLTAAFNDYELALFALGRKCDVGRALELLRANNEWRKEFGVEHMTGEQLGRIKGLLMSGVFQLVPFDKRASPGCSILYLFPANVPPEMQDITAMMQCSWFVLTRAAAAHVDNMRQGYVMVEDFLHVTLGKLMHLASDSSKNKKQFDSIQDKLPGRFRQILLANAPWWIRIPFRMMIVFMKAKLRSKFVLATPEEVAARLGGADRVPPSLGGTLPPFHPQQMLAMFPELEKYDIPVAASATPH